MRTYWMLLAPLFVVVCNPESTSRQGTTGPRPVFLQVGEPPMGLTDPGTPDPYEGDPRPHTRVQCVTQDVVDRGRLYQGLTLTKPVGLVSGPLCQDGEGFSANQVRQKGLENLTCSHPNMKVFSREAGGGAACLCYPMPDVLLTPAEIAHWCDPTSH